MFGARCPHKHDRNTSFGRKTKEMSLEDRYKLNELYWERGRNHFEARTEMCIGETMLYRYLLTWREWVQFKNDFNKLGEF